MPGTEEKFTRPTIGSLIAPPHERDIQALCLNYGNTERDFAILVPFKSAQKVLYNDTKIAKLRWVFPKLRHYVCMLRLRDGILMRRHIEHLKQPPNKNFEKIREKGKSVKQIRNKKKIDIFHTTIIQSPTENTSSTFDRHFLTDSCRSAPIQDF